MGAGPGHRTTTTEAEPPTSAPILVSGADETVRARIEATLELGGYRSVLACRSTEELIDAAREYDPALVVVAFAFEPFSPAGEIELVRHELAGTPLVLVATGFVGSSCRRLVPQGLDGLVGAGQIESGLVATVEAVLAEQLCVPAAMRGALAQPVFSHREKQVLELLLAEMPNSGIAARLFLSESTVKSHIASSFRKLGVSSRAEAARCMLAPDSGLELRGLSVAGLGPAVSAS